MRVAAIRGDGSVSFDEQYSWPGKEGAVSEQEKKVVIDEAADRVRTLLLDHRDHRISATFQAGNVDAPGLHVQFGPHTAEDCATLNQDPRMSEVWDAHCATKSEKFRLWWRAEPFCAFATETEALDYRRSSNLQLRLTPPNGSPSHYTIAFTRAVVERM